MPLIVFAISLFEDNESIDQYSSIKGVMAGYRLPVKRLNGLAKKILKICFAITQKLCLIILKMQKLGFDQVPKLKILLLDHTNCCYALNKAQLYVIFHFCLPANEENGIIPQLC